MPILIQIGVPVSGGSAEPAHDGKPRIAGSPRWRAGRQHGKTRRFSMHARLRGALIAVTLLAAQIATAEPLGPHFTITPFGGYTMYGTSQNSTYPDIGPLS